MKNTILFIVFILITFSSNFYSQDFVLVHGWLGDGSDWDNTGIENLIEGRAHDAILKPSLNILLPFFIV